MFKKVTEKLQELQKKSKCTSQPCQSCLKSPCCKDPGYATLENVENIYLKYVNNELVREDNIKFKSDLSFKKFIQEYFNIKTHDTIENFCIFFPKTIGNFGCVFNKRKIVKNEDNFKNCLLWNEERYNKNTAFPLGCINNGSSVKDREDLFLIYNKIFSNSLERLMEQTNNLPDMLHDKTDIVSSDVTNIKVDTWVRDHLSFSPEEEKVLETALQFDNGQSNYSSINFVQKTGITPYKKIHQSFMELETRYHAYKSIVRNLREAEVRVKIFERDIKKEQDELEKELMIIKLEDLMYDITVFKRKMKQCERELRTYLELLEQTKEKNLEEYLKEDDTEERKYWMARMQKQAAMDIIAYGRVGSGNMDSILLMPEEDQLETLRGALHFAGLLTSTIGQINKQVEGQINSKKALEGLQMPLLTDSKKLFEIKIDEKNIQYSDQSKTDGTTI
ncbi:MAG: hypothetical protein CXT73_02960 [Methanobacteriota archaeon]|nr:MAG: hypothetical protein CXT73_02960 [Euryarchaeota archaeon]